MSVDKRLKTLVFFHLAQHRKCFGTKASLVINIEFITEIKIGEIIRIRNHFEFQLKQNQQEKSLLSIFDVIQKAFFITNR